VNARSLRLPVAVLAFLLLAPDALAQETSASTATSSPQDVAPDAGEPGDAAVLSVEPTPQPAPEGLPYSTVVTANKIEQQPTAMTQSVRVLDSATWEQRSTIRSNLSQLMQTEPGQFVNPLSRNDANWGSAGGMGPSYNAYLLDGLPIDTFVDATSLDPWAFTRLEEQRGPASVMYGNYLGMDFAGNESPLAGVTNFVLKDRIDRAETRLLAGGGSWGTADVRAFHQDHAGSFHYFVGGAFERSDYANYGTADSWLHILHPPEYSDLKLYGKGSYFFDRPDHEISLFVHHDSRVGQVGRPNRDFNNGTDTLNAAYSNQLTDALGLQTKAGLRLYDRRWGSDNYPDLSLSEHDGVKQKVVPMDLTANFKHFGESLLTAGVDGQLAWYQTYAEVNGVQAKGNDASAHAVGVFAQEKLALGDWVLRAGGRFSHSGQSYSLIGGVVPAVASKSWDVPLWSAGVRFNGLGPVSLYANAGSSFVAPSAKAVGGTLLASDQGVAGKNGQLPNPDLKPQSGIGVDLGADLRVGNGFRAGVRAFANLLEDVIIDNVVSQDPSQTKSINAGTARSIGVEASAEHRVNRYVEWFANFTWTTTRIGNGVDPDQDGASVPFVPNFTANGGLTLRLPWQITAAPFVTGIGEYYDSSSKSGRAKFGPYAVLSMKLQKAFVLSDYSVIAAVDLNNLTNNRFVMPWQFQDPGFNALATLELRH